MNNNLYIKHKMEPSHIVTQVAPKGYNPSTQKLPKNCGQIQEHLFKEKYPFPGDLLWNNCSPILPSSRLQDWCSHASGLFPILFVPWTHNCQPALCGYFSVYFVLLDESNLTLLILPSTQLGHGTGPWLATHSSPKSWLYNLLEWLDPSGLISHVLRLLLCIYEFLWITT